MKILLLIILIQPLFLKTQETVKNIKDNYHLIYSNHINDQLQINIVYLAPNTKRLEVLDIMDNVACKQGINKLSINLPVQLKDLQNDTYFAKIGDEFEKVVKR